MGARTITVPEVRQVLCHGWHEKRKDTWRDDLDAWNYAVRGKTVDGKDVRVVVSFDRSGMLIITVIDVSR